MVTAGMATKFIQEIINCYGVMNTIVTNNAIWTITLLSTPVLTNVSHTFLESLLNGRFSFLHAGIPTTSIKRSAKIENFPGGQIVRLGKCYY